MTFTRLRFALCAVLAGVLAAGPIASAQTPLAGRETSAASVASYGLSQQMPVDPDVVIGTLPNGLRYYVRANGKPEHRAELRLVVKAGSVLEDDDQQGVAHFVEHMEFEGTRHFPGQSIADFLSSLGLSIGPDANAATSYDDTQYALRVPTDVAGVLDRVLLVLQDWAQGATFDQSGIDHERGIVLSEWRMHLGAGERTRDQIRRVQLEGSRYADRPPIGNPDIIEHVQREQLTRFYRDWYRPDLMAVIVVGDVDRDAVAAMIKDHFSSLSSPSPVRPRPAFDVPDHPGTRYAVITDKEATTTEVQLSDLRPARNQGSVGGYRDLMLDQLFSAMLGARLDELSQGANPPFLEAAANRGLFDTPRTRDEAILQALVSNAGVARGLDALVTELQRVARFGFTATELARAKQAMMLGSERVVTESPDRESGSRADEYTRNFLEGEALPTIWQELAFHRRFVPDITLGEVNALTGDWFPDQNRLVVVSAPEDAGVVLPDPSQLAAVITAASAKPLEPYVDAAAGQTLMDAPPPRGTIVKTTLRPEAGIIEWTLSNGATVVLKPTTLRADQILFRAAAPGGTSLASDDDFISARVADAVVPAGGVGRFSAVMLDKILAGKAVAVRPFIDEIDEGMGGGSTPQDLETMFQLLYLRFTQPRADPTAFAAMTAQASALLANQVASPDVVFNQAIEAILSQNNPRRQPETPATVAQWNLAKALAFCKARFADASHFTFVFVGSLTIGRMKGLSQGDGATECRLCDTGLPDGPDRLDVRIPDADTRESISAFIIERGTPGLAAGRKENKLGMRASDTTEVVLQECRIPADQLLGNEGQGFANAMAVLDAGRVGIAALAVGLAQGAYEAARRYALQREQFGQTIASFQAIRWKLADSATAIEAARLLTYQAAALEDCGLRVTRESAMAKLFASEACVRVAEEGVQIHGGYGFVKDYPAEKFFRDSKLCTIGEGTSEIQRLVIAREILRT